MSLELYAILIGVILILIDIFISSDWPTFIAILLFCFAFFQVLQIQLIYKIIFTILFFFAILTIYITVWQKIKDYLIDKWFAKDKYNAGVYGFAGKKGTVKIVNGVKYAFVNGDLYPFYQECPLEDQAVFVIKEVKDGKICIDSDQV